MMQGDKEVQIYSKVALRVTTTDIADKVCTVTKWMVHSDVEPYMLASYASKLHDHQRHVFVIAFVFTSYAFLCVSVNKVKDVQLVSKVKKV